ncbi:unnamed protein product [Strongylus vulgaris]|uniref:Neurotransmitter-gated ion-channel ligand-binding domain-containing protein n=1 Tax=Strongylus vulgaris TaxID=40348 RepID=A0A3P7IMZ9_STRVU|nr:unnamed protein product [Strongylus vulgaris]
MVSPSLKISAPPDGVVNITHEMELVHIINVDELKQIIRVLVYVVEQWDDPTLSWDPTNFSGLRYTWLPEESIWIPDIIVFNMLVFVRFFFQRKRKYELHMSTIRLDHQELLHSVRSPIRIEYNGRVTFSYPAIYSVMCRISKLRMYLPFHLTSYIKMALLDVARFPFDTQRCNLRVSVAWVKPFLQHYTANEEWALQEVGITQDHYDHEGTVVSEAKYIVSISRKPFYYLISLVLPSYIICMLSVAGLFARFSTKHERQERFTLGVTAILSMAVLSLVVTEKVPHSSEEVPLLIVYFHFNIVMVTLATTLTSTVMRVHSKGFSNRLLPPPSWLLRYLFIRGTQFTSIPNGNSPSAKRVMIAEKWGAVSRRMDHLLSLFFLATVSTPTMYLFLLCFSMDNITQERELLNGSREAV